MSWLPGISQLKSTFQLVTGDVDGARQTQKEFFQKCPVVSQATSLVQVIAGDEAGARETQRQCFSNLGSVANAVPVVGHVKAGVHLLCNDEAGAKRAFVSANRTSVVMGAGAAGGLVGGPVGAIGAGIAAGAAHDTVHSIAVNEERGIYAAIDAVEKSDKKGGAIFDLGLGVVGDGMAGNAGFQVATSIKNLANDAGVRGDAAAASQLEALGRKQNALDAQAAAGKISSQQYLEASNQLMKQAQKTKLVSKPVAGKLPVATKPPIVISTTAKQVATKTATRATTKTATRHQRVETTTTRQGRVESVLTTTATRKGRQESESESSSDEEDEEYENVDVIVPRALHSGGIQGSNGFRVNRKKSANEVRKLAKKAQVLPTFYREELGRKVLDAYQSFKPSTYSGFGIRCVLINTQSITPTNSARRQEKLAALAALATTHEVIIMTETWLKPISDTSQLRTVLSGFELFRHDRRNRRGGGVAIAVKRTVSASRFRFSREASLPWEIIGLTLTKGGKRAKLLAVYRPPSGSISRASLEVSDDLIMAAYEEFVGRNPGVPVVWVGDFNLDGVYFEQGEARLRVTSGRPSSIMEAFATERVLEHAVTRRTHRGNYLDLVMHSEPHGVHTVEYSDSVFSAHSLVHFTIVPE